MSLSNLDWKKGLNVEKIRLEGAAIVVPISKTKRNVVKSAPGLIFIDPRSDKIPKYKVRAANGVCAEFLPENPFSLFLSSFRDHD